MRRARRDRNQHGQDSHAVLPLGKRGRPALALIRPSASMPAKAIALTVVAVAAIACARADNPQTKRDSTSTVPPQPLAAPIAKSNAPCTLAGGRLRVSNDSVGQFDIHTATIGQ